MSVNRFKMKKIWLLISLLIGWLLLTGCNNSVVENPEVIDSWNIVDDNIELTGYASNLTYESPFVPWDIPENFSWNIIEIDNYWITTKFDKVRNKEDIFENSWYIFNLTWSGPNLVKDKIHGIDLLLSERFSEYPFKIAILHNEERDGINIRKADDWEYPYFNGNTAIWIAIEEINNPSYWYYFRSENWYLWKNNKYEFFLEDSYMIGNLFYKDYKQYSEYLNNFFLWFKFFNI